MDVPMAWVRVCPTHLGSRLAGLLGSLLHCRGRQHVVLPVAQGRVGHTVHALQRRDVAFRTRKIAQSRSIVQPRTATLSGFSSSSFEACTKQVLWLNSVHPAVHSGRADDHQVNGWSGIDMWLQLCVAS